jgi:NADPH2:quinone reductase
MNLPLLKNFSVVGVFAGAWEDREPEAARQAKEQIMTLIAAGKLSPHVGLVMPMAEIGRAMAAIGERSATGRVVVTIR